MRYYYTEMGGALRGALREQHGAKIGNQSPDSGKRLPKRKRPLAAAVPTVLGHRRGPERVTGIEPAFSAWEADVLPLNYTRAETGSYRWPRTVRISELSQGHQMMWSWHESSRDGRQ